MSFLTQATAPDPTVWLRIQALETWRRAARLVSTRWDLVLVATPEARQGAYAAYGAALDAEAAAAAELANLDLGEAEY
jgi:hypothetical protein